MIFKSRLAIISALMSLIMLGLVSGSNSPVSATADHPIDQALLLMFSSHARLNGEVESALISTTHLAALSQQTSSVNEIDALASLYSDMIHKLRASDNYDSDLENRLVAEYQAKVLELQQKAEALEAARSQPRRRGGIVGFINRGVKALGRGTGWIMGKAMDGAGKVGIFAIEEVGPRVLKEAVLGGVPLNAQLIRQVARELLIKRVRTAGENHLLRLAERINRGRAAQSEALATEDPHIMETYEAEFGLDAYLMKPEEMDATMEARKTPQSAQVPDNGSSGDGGGGDSDGRGSSVPDFTKYTFTDRDVPNFGSSTFGTSMFTWHRWAGHVPAAYQPIYNYCFYVSNIPIETGTVRVTFDQETMTASGTIEGDFHLTKTPDSYAEMGTTEIDVRGSYRVEFSNLPGIPTNNGYSFTGTGNSELQIGGSIICRGHDTDTNQDFFKPITDQSSSQMQIPLSITLWNPGTVLLGSQPATVSITGDAGPVNDLSISLYLILD